MIIMLHYFVGILLVWRYFHWQQVVLDLGINRKGIATIETFSWHFIRFLICWISAVAKSILLCWIIKLSKGILFLERVWVIRLSLNNPRAKYRRFHLHLWYHLRLSSTYNIMLKSFEYRQFSQLTQGYIEFRSYVPKLQMVQEFPVLLYEFFQDQNILWFFFRRIWDTCCRRCHKLLFRNLFRC